MSGVPMGGERRQHEDGQQRSAPCDQQQRSERGDRHLRQADFAAAVRTARPAPPNPPAVDRVHPRGYARSSLGAFSPRAPVRTVVGMTSKNSPARLSPAARVDVTDPASVEALIERTVAGYGRLDGGRLAGGG
jgi:NAD(P)-dependent dehydrogenase (short-subunit alcohol dehydrogenase family)